MGKSHPNVEQLLAYAAGTLTPDEAAAIEHHLAQNLEAAQLVARYREVAELARADDSVAPPAETLAAARSLFRERRARRMTNWWDELRRVVADLVFDSRPQATRAGVRGCSDTYQISFESEVADIDLEVQRAVDAAGQCGLRGQVSTHGDAPIGAIALLAAGTFEPRAAVEVDEHGAFRVELPPGRVDLLVEVNDVVLVLPDVELE